MMFLSSWRRDRAKISCTLSFGRLLLEGRETRKAWAWLSAWSILLILLFVPLTAPAQHPSTGSGQVFDGAKAYEYAREFAAIGPRWPTGPGHVKAEEFLRAHFVRAHDQH